MNQICQVLETAWHAGSLEVLAIITVGQGHVTLICP